MFPKLYEIRLQADENAKSSLNFTKFTDNITENHSARLAFLYATPTSWPKRSDVLRLQWRGFWHRYHKAVDEVHKLQKDLAAAFTGHKQHRFANDAIERGVAAGAALASRGGRGRDSQQRLDSATPQPTSGGGGAAPADRSGTPATKGRKGKRTRSGADAATGGPPPPPPGSAPGPAPLPPSAAPTGPGGKTPLAAGVQPKCHVQLCTACSVASGNRHAATCSWVASARAAGRVFYE